MSRLSADTPLIHDDCELVDVTFGAYVEIGKGSRILNTSIGDYSYCDRYADIANAKIGKFANIAAHSRIGATDHPLQTASLHHFLYRSADYWEDADSDTEFFARRKARTAHIGHDTWIGHGAMIKPEVTVGDGAVVASGAVVTKDVSPYTIVAGTPAKLLRRRQPDPVAARLQELGWWNWDHSTLRAALDDFRSLSAEVFLERYET